MDQRDNSHWTTEALSGHTIERFEERFSTIGASKKLRAKLPQSRYPVLFQKARHHAINVFEVFCAFPPHIPPHTAKAHQ